MRVMIFIDNSNFFNSIRKLNSKCQDRIIDYSKINKFVLKYLSNNPQYSNEKLNHIRTYYYDGEYTDTLLNKIKKHLSEIEDNLENQEERHRIQEIINKTSLKMEAQKRAMDRARNYYYFETRLKPLQYGDAGIFQKGVDVQLAVDLVSNAYLNNYDVAVLFSGDIDLYESIKSVKHLGKHVIIFSHINLTSNKMIEICDFYKDISLLDNHYLNEFTHIFEKRH